MDAGTEESSGGFLAGFRHWSSILSIFGLVVLILLILGIGGSSSISAKSKQESIKDLIGVFFLLFVILVVVVTFVPSLGNLGKLFSQISNVSYALVYTLVLTFSLTLIPKDTLNKYSSVFTWISALLGVGAFYLSMRRNLSDDFDANYERVKSIILLLCLVTVYCVFYFTDPGGLITKNFGTIMFLTILLGIFAIVYLFILFTVPTDINPQKDSVLGGFSWPAKIATMFPFLLLILFGTLWFTNPGNFMGMNAGPEKGFYGGLSVMAMLLVLFLSFLPALSYMFPSGSVGGEGGRLDTFKKALLAVFGFALSFTLIAWITMSVQSFSASKSGWIGLLSNLFLILVVLTLVYKSLSVSLQLGAKENSLVSLIVNTLFYIPCLLSGVLNTIGGFGVTVAIFAIIASFMVSRHVDHLFLKLLVALLVLTLVYQFFETKMPAGNSRKSAFFSLLYNIVFYIPCLITALVGLMQQGYKSLAEEWKSVVLLLVALGITVGYFFMPSFFNIFNLQGGKQLVNLPVYTNEAHTLATYEELNGTDMVDYQYSISFWLYLDSTGGNMAESSKKYTSVLNYGGKPNVLYNAELHTLMITTKPNNVPNQKRTARNPKSEHERLIDFDEEGNRILYKNDKLKLQKWNQFIINYSGGVMDIFLNGELVKSDYAIVPYFTYESLTIGEQNGVKGGICNVVYFSRPLNYGNVYYSYNMLKYRTPPVLNDSNVQILKDDLKLAAGK